MHIHRTCHKNCIYTIIMEGGRNYRFTTTFHSFCALLIFFSLNFRYSHSEKEFAVGVILDTGSWNGRMVNSCIMIAASDFYNINGHYQTRIVTQIIDSKGDPLKALEAVQDLLKKNVGALFLGPEMSLDGTLLALLSEKAKVPMFSLGGSLTSSDEYPYFFQLSHSEALQSKATAALVESFQWKTVNFICEDSEFKSGVLSHLFEYFQEKSIQIGHISALSSMISDDGIRAQLNKLMSMQTKIFVVHMSPSLASRLFLSVKSLGMMSEGYAWILTDKTRNFINSEELMQQMEGALALKPYVPPSIKLQNLTLRWRKEFQDEGPFMNVKELSPSCVWAYDAIWVLAGAVEGAYTKQYPKLAEEHSSESKKILMKELVKTRLKGISGDFQIVNWTVSLLKAFEIVNVIREGERRVGFWEKGVGITSEIMHSSLSSNDLKVIIWPGGSITAPRVAWPRGKKLSVGIPKKNSFTEFISLEYDIHSNTTRALGFCADVFEAALEALQYEVPIEYIPFVDANGESKGTYTDLLYQIYLEKYDAVVGDVTITNNRSHFVDFTIPYTDIGVGTITKVKENKDMWIFTKPVGADLCLITAVFFILTAIVIWFIEKPFNKEFQGSLYQQIGTIFLSTLFLSSRQKLSSNLSRFVMFIWVILVLILTSSYTATLASLLTVQQIGLASRGANVGYQTDSFVERAIASNLNFMDYSLRPYSSAEEYADALSKGSKNGGVDGIIDEMPYIKAFLSKYSPDYAMVDSASTTNGFSFAFRKGSPLVPEISRAIAKLREEGTLDTLEKKWYNKPSSLVNQELPPKPQVLKVDSFGGLFVIGGVSLGLALFARIFYIIRSKLNIYNYMFQTLASGNLAIMLRHMISSSELKETTHV
ncbi:glutamate receptor 1.4 [Daucus carota subsp. sativus]|nr:PREDICTED: glutamate receptor 1.4-like isoform X1 [Daucus carota subsp. sativus]